MYRVGRCQNYIGNTPRFRRLQRRSIGRFKDFFCYGALGIGSCRIIFIAVFIICRGCETSNCKNFDSEDPLTGMAGDRELATLTAPYYGCQLHLTSIVINGEMGEIDSHSHPANPTGKGRIEKVRDRPPPEFPPRSQLENHREKTRPELALTFNCIKLRNGGAHILVKSTYSGFKKLYKKNGSAPIQSSIFTIVNKVGVARSESDGVGRRRPFPPFPKWGKPEPVSPAPAPSASENVLSWSIRWAVNVAKLCRPGKCRKGELRVPGTLKIP